MIRLLTFKQQIMKNTIKNSLKIILFKTLLFLLIFIGCARLFGFVSYYDPTTYKNLTELKPEVTKLYESF